MKKSEAVSECEDLYRIGNALKRSDRGRLVYLQLQFFLIPVELLCLQSV